MIESIDIEENISDKKIETFKFTRKEDNSLGIQLEFQIIVKIR